MKTTVSSKVGRGTTIVQSTGRDNSSHDVKNPMGGSVGGSKDNLSHTLSGAKANQSGAG
jgi:hypothetical protein